jgi:RNA polymerase sigma-32 factor
LEIHRHGALNRALATLPERDQDILRSRHFQEKPVGLLELGQRHGVSAERVRQLEKRALVHMRTHMGEALAP